MANLFTEIYRIVKRIPAGRVLSYGDVAALCKGSVSARTVGWAMSAAPEGVPWFRVVNHRGELSIGKRSGVLQDLQKNLLESEKVTFVTPDRVNIERHRWHPRQSQRGRTKRRPSANVATRSQRPSSA
jgi:methylated-DNA-protein-cysteine methyltransferase-like protein